MAPWRETIRWAIAAVFCVMALSPLEAAAPSKLVATSHGAAGEVSGSLHVLDTGNGRWMVDCGAVLEKDTPGVTVQGGQSHFRGEDADSQGDLDRAAKSGTVPSGGHRGFDRPQSLPAGVESVSAVFLTHAHVDHLGRLPLLIEGGFAGPIYMTEATAALAVPMLRAEARGNRSQPRHWSWSKDALSRAEAGRKALWVHWRGCKYRREIAGDSVQQATCSMQELTDRFGGRTPRVKAALCPECVKEEIESVMRLARPVKYGTATDVAEGVRATFLDAGHIPGSASVLFEVTLGGRAPTRSVGRRRVLFSGDLGNTLSPLLPGPRPAPPCDAVFVETTYGTAHRGPSVSQHRAMFRRAVAEAVAHDGVVWIPCFSLDRTQKIFYELHLAQQEKLLPETLPIYCPSPTAREVTALYNAHRQSGWFSPPIAADSLAFTPSKVHTAVPSANRLPHPCIIISTSDILLREWMRRLLSGLLPEPSTAVLLVSYQDPDSAGGLLKQGAAKLDIDGQTVPVLAKVQSFQCFTGHGDATDIDAWLADVPQAATIVLVHGDKEELDARAEQLRQRGRRRVIVAKPGETIDLQR